MKSSAKPFDSSVFLKKYFLIIEYPLIISSENQGSFSNSSVVFFILFISASVLFDFSLASNLNEFRLTDSSLRYDNNKKTTQKETFDLGDLVKKCQDKLAIEIKKKNHTVNCFVTADVPPVYADKYDIERVVLNILTNSIKYTKEGGEIKIYVGFVYNDAYIKIFDNGIGIPEEDLARIFERFYRVDKARTREMGGTGLGLSIAKEILDKNGGSIDIKSVVGEGTEVVVKIPTKQEKN